MTLTFDLWPFAGATGRELTLPADCLGHSSYRVGWKRAFSLYPRTVRERILKERQKKFWEPQCEAAVAKAVKKAKDAQEKAKKAEEIVSLSFILK